MKVIYSLSSYPYRKIKTSPFKIDKFDLYTAVISSLVRRRDGDYTIMNCDSAAAEYLRVLGITSIWNEIKVNIPDDFEGINPIMFWAAGKLFALKNTSAPLLALDTDFIAWNLPELSDRITAAHREPLNPDTYPDILSFKMKSGYSFNPDFNYNVEPLNTAFLYFPEDGFKNYYVEEVLRFMKSAKDCNDTLHYMVYAEQRLLALLAEYCKKDVNTILEWEALRLPQKNYTHTWGAKRVMRENKSENERFCEKCRRRISADFPDWTWVIGLIENG